MALWSTSCQGERIGVGKGGERGRERSGEQKGTGNGEKGGRREQGGQRGSESKRRPLVGNAVEYQENYGGRGAD